MHQSVHRDYQHTTNATLGKVVVMLGVPPSHHHHIIEVNGRVKAEPDILRHHRSDDPADYVMFTQHFDKYTTNALLLWNTNFIDKFS